MATDSEADKIEQDRERRRGEERLRIDDDRRHRQLALARLRRMELLGSMDERDPGLRRHDVPSPEGAAPREGKEVVPERAGRTLPPGLGQPPGGAHSEPPEARRPSRQIGAAIRSEAVRQFLALDPTERFDVQMLNGLQISGLVGQAGGDRTLLQALARRAEALMIRIKREVDDPLGAGAFLREQALLWYSRSPEEPDWRARMAERWAGIFAESRVSGGKLRPWLNLRLWHLRDACIRTGGLTERLRRGLLRNRACEQAVARTPAQQIQAETAQALLDDLATGPRDLEGPLPLVRLSELAVRRQIPTVNDALSQLFSSAESGPFVILHPNRYPHCDEVLIRPPTPGAGGAALAYALVSQKPNRRALSRLRSSIEPGTGTGADDDAVGSAEAEGFDLAGESIWELRSVPDGLWQRLIAEQRSERRRIEAPPKDFRVRPAYIRLRDLLLDDAGLRTTFLAVKWRGRPSGLSLLVTLLAKGSIAPDVVTDHEYLEAELGELTQDDPQWRPPDGEWSFRGWRVTREGSHRDGFRYRAERSQAPEKSRSG